MSRELALAAGNQTPRAPPPRLCAPPSSLCTHSLWPLPSVQSPWECRKYIMFIRFKSNTRGLPNTRQEVNISSQKYGWCFFCVFFYILQHLIFIEPSTCSSKTKCEVCQYFVDIRKSQLQLWLGLLVCLQQEK